MEQQSIWQDFRDEITKLRAENERLKAERDNALMLVYKLEGNASVLRAENELLKAENDRLLTKLEIYRRHVWIAHDPVR